MVVGVKLFKSVTKVWFAFPVIVPNATVFSKVGLSPQFKLTVVDTLFAFKTLVIWAFVFWNKASELTTPDTDGIPSVSFLTWFISAEFNALS